VVKFEAFDYPIDPSFAHLVSIALPYQAVVGRRGKSIAITGWKAKLGNRGLKNGREGNPVSRTEDTLTECAGMTHAPTRPYKISSVRCTACILNVTSNDCYV